MSQSCFHAEGSSAVLQSFLLFLHVCSQDFQFSPINLIFINFEGIYSFLFPIETKAKPLPQCSIFSDLHSEVKTLLKSIGWSNLAVFIIQCLSEAVVFCSLVFKKILNQQSTIQDPDTLCVLFLYRGITIDITCIVFLVVSCLFVCFSSCLQPRFSGGLPQSNLTFITFEGIHLYCWTIFVGLTHK